MGSEGVQASSLLLRTIRWDQMCEVGGEILSFIFLLSSFFQKTKFGEEESRKMFHEFDMRMSLELVPLTNSVVSFLCVGSNFSTM